MINVGMIGAGSWGIALTKLLADNGHQVTVWSALEDEIKMLSDNHEHITKLPGVKLDDSITYTTNLEQTIVNADVCVMAVPSTFVRTTAQKMKSFVKEGQIIVSVAKGIEESTLMTLSDIIEQEIPQSNVTVMCGPSHAEEVGKQIPTTVVVGAHDKKTAEYLQDIFINENFRVYISPDMLGMEIGASLKNVVALAAGVCDGLGYGDNTRAALITRGIAEISRLGIAMGGKEDTFYGLTGIGDLIVTCSSIHSRNHNAGVLLGKGYTMQQAMDEVKMVVEGVYSAKAAMALANKYDVELPIIEQVNKILFENKSAAVAVRDLMMREQKSEIDENFGA